MQFLNGNGHDVRIMMWLTEFWIFLLSVQNGLRNSDVISSSPGEALDAGPSDFSVMR
jgi:hypothetical protein